MNILAKPLLVVMMAGFLTAPFSADIYAQEYKYEAGGAVGITSYMGDANKTRYMDHPGFAAGLLFRYNINFHWALKTNLLAGRISGDTRDSGNIFPSGQPESFRRTFAEAATQAEFNFLPYSDKYRYMGTKPYTPYLFVGAGITYAPGEFEYTGMNMPFGVGFKFKLKNRLNIAIECSMRKLFGDDFDVTQKKTQTWSLEQPYGIGSSLLKNRDWYSVTMICLTWDFGLREDPCHGN
jgi:hypothetical protein